MKKHTPSFKLLAGFEAAARHGNFSRAADELFLSPSAISHQIQTLEEQLGQTLFRRVGRGVELTVAGKVLLRSVQISIDTLQNGLNRLETYLDEGLVVLVCPAILLHGWLQPRLKRLQHDMPQLSPFLSTDESARYVDEIDVDIAISQRALNQAHLIEVPLFVDEWVMVANRATTDRLASIAFAEHAQHVELICLEESFTSDETAVAFRNYCAAFKKRMIYDDARLLLDAVSRGLGIAYLPRLLCDELMAQGQLFALPDYPKLAGKTWWLSKVANNNRVALTNQWFDWLLAQAESDKKSP